MTLRIVTPEVITPADRDPLLLQDGDRLAVVDAEHVAVAHQELGSVARAAHFAVVERSTRWQGRLLDRLEAFVGNGFGVAPGGNTRAQPPTRRGGPGGAPSREVEQFRRLAPRPGEASSAALARG